jgi:hypothetical protein
MFIQRVVGNFDPGDTVGHTPSIILAYVVHYDKVQGITQTISSEF